MSQRILVVDDEVRYRELYLQTLDRAGFETAAAGSVDEAMRQIEKAMPALVISDVRMPGADGLELLRQVRRQLPALPFLLVTAFADVRQAVQALKLGAVDYLAKPVDLDELLTAVRDAVGGEAATLDFQVPPEALRGIVARSPAMLAVLRDASRIAASEANVLLTGESGAGKDVVARFIHRNSPRRERAIVTVNCAAIPDSLLASELFGHKKGAFTGAIERRQGHFREADGGTLFLDEIGDMSIELQAALLRAIETGYVSPVGSDHEVKVDFRLLAATNRNLMQDVTSGRFRHDLYYRLNVVALEVPPLRDRPEDIVPLGRHFLAQSGSAGKRLSHAAVRVMTAYAWPGNVRELANAMEHAGVLCPGDVILPEHLPPAVAREPGGPIAVRKADGAPEATSLAEREIEAVRQALAQTGGNRTRAAELLGITRRGLIYKLKRLGLTDSIS